MNLLVLVGIAIVSIYFGKTFFRKLLIFASCYLLVLLLSNCNVETKHEIDRKVNKRGISV